MAEENWCMQWSNEVLPEPAMIPDLNVFLCAVATPFQAVTGGRCSQISLARGHEIKEAFCVEAQGKVPARLKLPFTLSPSERRERARQISKAHL